MRSILEPESSVDWKELVVEKIGSNLSAKPMLRYLEPRMGWLKELNERRKATLANIRVVESRCLDGCSSRRMGRARSRAPIQAVGSALLPEKAGKAA